MLLTLYGEIQIFSHYDVSFIFFHTGGPDRTHSSAKFKKLWPTFFGCRL